MLTPATSDRRTIKRARVIPKQLDSPSTSLLGVKQLSGGHVAAVIWPAARREDDAHLLNTPLHLLRQIQYCDVNYRLTESGHDGTRNPAIH
jgi:hypothetical protein